jgi:hypothetical protein
MLDRVDRAACEKKAERHRLKCGAEKFPDPRSVQRRYLLMTLHELEAGLSWRDS